MAKTIELTVTVVVEATPNWAFVAADALREVGHVIYMDPAHVEGKGESLTYQYEYTVVGRE